MDDMTARPTRVQNETEEPVLSGTWFRDAAGDLWNLNKAEGGLRVEKRDGTFGKVVPTWVAREDYGVEPVDADEALVLDEFEALKSQIIKYHGEMDDFRDLRAKVVSIVRLAKAQQARIAIEQTE